MPLIAASSYSWFRDIREDRCELHDTPALAAKAGADAIEFALGGPLSDPLHLAMRKHLANAADDAGIPVCSICVAADLLEGNTSQRRASINAVKRQLDEVAAMQVKRFRHDAALGLDGKIDDAAFEQALPVLASACRDIALHAKMLSIRSSIENHGRFVQHADRVLRLIDAVDHPNFGITLDIGNSTFARQKLVEASAKLAKQAINVHVKDFRFVADQQKADNPHVWTTYEGGPTVVGSVIDEGDLPVGGCVAAILDAGYRGPWVVEFEGPTPDCQTAVALGIVATRILLQRARPQSMG